MLKNNFSQIIYCSDREGKIKQVIELPYKIKKGF